MKDYIARTRKTVYNLLFSRANRVKDGRVVMPKRKRDREKGVSLIEVLITVFILAIVCITLISVFIYGFTLLARTKQVALATQVAQLEVEEYRNMAFADIDTSTSLTRAFVDLYGNDPTSPYRFLFNSDNQPFLLDGQETLIVEDGALLGMDENIKKLTVTVTWVYRGRQQRKDVVTYFTKDGINRR